MNKKRLMPLFVPIFWFFTTACWSVTFTLGLRWGTTPVGLLLLQGLCVLTSLAAAIANLLRWRRGRNTDNT